MPLGHRDYNHGGLAALLCSVTPEDASRDVRVSSAARPPTPSVALLASATSVAKPSDWGSLARPPGDWGNRLGACPNLSAGQEQPQHLAPAIVPAAASAQERSGPDAASVETPLLGDHVVMRAWGPSDPVVADVLSVQPGDRIYISRSNPDGWAYGAFESGRRGWLPACVCRLRTLKVVAPYDADGSPSDLLRLRPGEHMVVFRREGDGWTYGARVGPDGRPLASGWFPSWAVGEC